MWFPFKSIYMVGAQYQVTVKVWTQNEEIQDMFTVQSENL